jgi:hypothetical protein
MLRIRDRVIHAREKKGVVFLAGDGFGVARSIADQFAGEFQLPNRQLAGVPEGDGDRVRTTCATDQRHRTTAASLSQRTQQH